MTTAQRTFRIALLALTLGVPVAAVSAQTVDCALASKATLDPADVAVVRKFLADQAPKLKSADDPAVSEEARDAILKPLKCNQVSLDFRLQLSGPAFAELAKAVGDPADHVALNALRVFGELGTQQSVEAIKPALADAKRPAVRCMAAMSMRDILAGAAQNNAIRDPAPILDAVSQRLAAETDVNVVENLVLALDATRNNPSVHQNAMRKMAVALTTQAKALRARAGEAHHDRWVRVLIRGTDGAFQPMMNAGGANLDNAFRTDVAMLCGQALAYVRDRLDADKPSAGSDESKMLSTLVNTSERALVLIDSAVRKVPVQKQVLVAKFDEAVAQGDSKGFAAEVEKWIGDSGTLTKAPYNAKAADFAN